MWIQAAIHADLWCDENPNQALKMDPYPAQAGKVFARMRDAPCAQQQGVPLQL